MIFPGTRSSRLAARSGLIGSPSCEVRNAEGQTVSPVFGLISSVPENSGNHDHRTFSGPGARGGEDVFEIGSAARGNAARSRPARVRSERGSNVGETLQLGVYSTGTVQRRLMRLATNPAPKPLSIFTTVTFDAQEFNIPSNAATPPKDAPYPMLVGTATTGTPTRPPTTDGNAPSIPAATITTRERCNRLRSASTR